MIVWCEQCNTEPVDVVPEDFLWPKFPGPYKRPLCSECLYRDYPQRYVVGYQNLDGEVFTEEVSQDEYFRICMGEGSTQKPDYAKRVMERINAWVESDLFTHLT